MVRISVINDDLVSPNVLGDLLEGGYDAITCCDGREAFSMLMREHSDVIILDLLIKKPEAGWDILTFLQLHPTLRNIPVIVSSGLSDELLAKEEWLLEHGIDVLSKPFDIDELYRHVDAALDTR